MSEEKEKQNHKIHIAVENFGPIEKAEIDLRPLTIFVGESNTGKTYLAALIYAIQRAFDGIPRVPWSYYNTSKFDPIYYAGPADLSTDSLINETQNVQEKLTQNDKTFKFTDLPEWVQKRLLSGKAHLENLERELKRCFDVVSVSELKRDNSSSSQNQDMRVTFRVDEECQTLWSYDFYNAENENKTDKFINENIVLNSEDRELFIRALNVKDKGIPLRFSMPTSSYYYLPAPRSGLMEAYGIIAISLVDRATRIELDNSNHDSMLTGMTADFLKHLYSYRKPDIYIKSMHEIAEIIEKRLLKGKIELFQTIEGGFPHFLYRPQNTEKSISMNQSSSMVSELAPLVIFLRGIVKPGDTLIIEEPEAHLHPIAQTKIAITLARLVREGVRVIITTHSDWLLEQIGNLVREGEVKKLDENLIEPPSTWLNEEEVGAWRFYSDKPVEEIKFDLISGFEPQDYGEVAEELYNRSVELRVLLKKKLGDATVE